MGNAGNVDVLISHQDVCDVMMFHKETFLGGSFFITLNSLNHVFKHLYSLKKFVCS